MFSGIWFRIVAFVLVYALLLGFLYSYAKKVERPIDSEGFKHSFVYDAKMTKGLKFFSGIMCGGNIPMTFLNGVGNVFPAVFMILMANSIKYTMIEGHILEPILQGMVGAAATLPRWSVILFIYLIVLIMNFFISSGSAKAFLLMPLIIPIAETFGISAQLCIVAFAFGDGFSNVLYPTNPVLLISLGLADIDYGKWFKWSFKFQFINLILTSALLLVGLAIGY